jgi:hypothetical protein
MTLENNDTNTNLTDDSQNSEATAVDTTVPMSVAPASTFVDRATGAVFTGAFEMVNSYIARFAEQHNLLEAALDATGYVQIKRGSAHIGINVLEENGVLLLLAPLFDVPEQNTHVLYRRLLELSFLATHDAAFAIDSTKNVIYVRSLRRLSGLDYEGFEDLLDTVGSIANEWGETLSKEFTGYAVGE